MLAASLRSGCILLFRKSVKNVKEDHGFVPASRGTATNAVPVRLGALSEALCQPVELPGHHLGDLGEMFFSPQRITGPQHSYYGPGSPPPSRGLAQLVLSAAEVASSPTEMASLLGSVVVTG